MDMMSVTVIWDAIPLAERRGEILGYVVEYALKSDVDNVSKLVVIPDVIVVYGLSTTLRDLSPGLEYYVRVAGFTEDGNGYYSNEIVVKIVNPFADPCISSPCLNGGTCSPHVENYQKFYCICSYNFTGIFCGSFINDAPCHSPNVSLSKLLPDSDSSAVSIRRSNSFLIQSNVILDCALSQKTTFTWSIYNYDQLIAGEAPLLSRNGSSEFRIMPHMLSIGNYLVRLTVNMFGTQVFGVGQGFIKVTSSPLVALIAGGTKVVRGFNRSLVFDASMSYDPDEENQQSSSLNFTWMCTNSSNLEGCYRNGDKIESNESVLTVNSGLMLENNSYFINVKITKDQRQAEYTQELFIVPGNPPEVQIRCVDNCNVKSNPSGRMALQGTCAGYSCEGTLTYHWSLFKATNSSSSNETQWLEIPEIQQLISTKVSSTTLVTYPRVLEPDMLYKFIFTAKRPGEYQGYSEYRVTTNSPPTGGYCQVSPESGVTLDTEFTFICGNWQDEDLPLQYEFIYFRENDLLNVVYKGQQTSKHTKLPFGDKANNFTIDFRVRVADMFGTFTEVNTPVQVVEPNIEATNLVDIAANLTTGDDSELSKLIQSGDLSRAVQLATAAIVAVDDTAHVHAASQEELTTKRIAMKSSILQQMSAVRVETLVRVQQVSNVIAEATSVISEVTVEAQEAATNALLAMTSVLKAESLAGESFETLFDGARSLVTGLGSMLRVSSFGAKVYDGAQASPKYRRRRSTGNGTSLLSDILVKRRERDTVNAMSDERQRQSKARANGILNSLDDVGSTILTRTLVGEQPRELSAKSVSLLVSREEPGLLAGSILSSKGSSFTLPPATDLFGNDTQFVDSQMATTDYIPFSWDSSAARVTTGVSSLQMKNSSGNVLNITELESPILIKLPNTQDLKTNSRPHFLGADKTVYHKINVTTFTAGMTLLLKIRPENNATEFLVFGKYNVRPSIVNSDFNKIIPDFSSCVYDRMSAGFVNCSRDPYIVYVDSAHANQTGYYYIGIQIKSKGNGISRLRRCVGQGRSKRSCVQHKEPPTTGASFNIPQYLQGDENYTMQVIQAACLYWSTELSKWTTKGCKVDETTTEDAIRCSCSHLSAFGGQLLVAPNPIDFDKVFTEFTRLHETGNVAVIMAVSCVFGLYLLLLVFARKYDKLDHQKLGERPLLGVRSPWAHFYEIEVSTGIWRNSGTSAKVFITLQGEQGASRPYQLKDDSYIPFARGSIISFTLSIPINIGPIRNVRVWHDNSGSSPSWFLNHIKVSDVSAQKQLTFMCYTWLAVDSGDGLVDRTLSSAPATGKGMDFMVYVQNKIAEEFSDKHLWFSVATRSPKHRFTRVERLSCCLSLLLTTMLASAMFYQFDTGVDNSQGTLQLGRFVLNLREFIIAVQSLSVVVPVNLLIVEIFTHTRSAKENKQPSKKLAKKKCEFSLPHYFIYLAWLLCFLTAFGSASFVIFYSLQWGKDTSEQWLLSIGMSVFMDIFVSQPLRIIVVAFILSHIFKTRDQSSTQVLYHAEAVVDVEDIQLSEQDEGEEDTEMPKPPSKKQLRRARNNRLRELRMFTALRKIVSYLIYLWILIIVCYGGRNEHGFLMTSSVGKVFGSLNKISSHARTWVWARDVLVPGLFEDGKQNSSNLYIGDGDSVLVGMPRLRQLRVKQGSCEVVDEARTLFDSCVASYSYGNEDKTLYYLPRWRLLSSTENVLLSDLDQICPAIWRYASAKQTHSLPFWGRLHPFGVYGQGGYLAELGYDGNTASKIISELNLLNWVDRFTSVVFVEFTVFNPGVSLFSVFTIPIEFSPSGYVVSNQVIRTLHVYDLGGGYSAITVVCQLLLVFYIIYFIVTETKQIIQGVRIYFTQFLNLVELAQTITVIGFVVTHVLKETELFANTAKLHENIFQFISFDKGVFLDILESVLVSLLMFFNTVKLLYLFKFNSHVNHLIYVMKRSARELLHCSLGLFVFMSTFIHFGYLAFGKDIDAYSSPFSVLQTLLTEGVIGGANYFQDCCVLGRVYILGLKLGLNFICINIFISVLDDNYHIVKNLSKKKFNLGLFMIKRMKEIMGCVGAQPETPEQPRKEKRAEQETQELEAPNKTESALKLVDDLERRARHIKHSLNDIYSDDFGDDSDMLRLWLDIHLQRIREASEKDGGGDYCALASGDKN